MQLFSPEAIKYLHDQEHDIVIATMSALTLAGMIGMMKGMHSIWRLLSTFQPTFDAHVLEDKQNFTTLNEGLVTVKVRQDLQEVSADRLGNKIDSLSNRVEHASQKIEERDPILQKMHDQLKSLVENKTSDATAD